MMDRPWMLFAVLPLAAYVIGSTPFAVIIARRLGHDLRAEGSGNVGATNCGRVCGRKWGYLCFALDVAKGLVPVMLAGLVIRRASPGRVPDALHQAAWLLVGCGAVAGHVFSFWLKFRGGKGVASSLGVVLGVWPYFTFAGLVALGVWLVVTLASRYVSLGSIAAAVVFLPAFAVLNWPPTDLWPMGAFAAAMVALIIVRHRGNISRLLAGRENKISRPRLR
ncbi:MAG: glycerol-3-phosphate 1-O-acyltransferase PlsY [Planctomycetes bacterium]|nr:glycerol-3-phosphate 1-O-acyltransferase PlsY [Planctomycetota bacterium]